MVKECLIALIISIPVFSQKISVENSCEYILSQPIPEYEDNHKVIVSDSSMTIRLKRGCSDLYQYANIGFTPYNNYIYEILQYIQIKNDNSFARENMKMEFMSRLYKIDEIFKVDDSLRKFEPTKFNGTTNSGSEIIYDYGKIIVSEKYPDTVYVRISLQFEDSMFLISEKYVDFKLKHIWLPEEREWVKKIEEYNNYHKLNLDEDILD